MRLCEADTVQKLEGLNVAHHTYAISVFQEGDVSVDEGERMMKGERSGLSKHLWQSHSKIFTGFGCVY